VIVSCEQCHCKFRLSQNEVSAVKDEGRILKCGNCHHMWLVSKNLFNLNFKSHDPSDPSLIDKLKNENNLAITLLDTVADTWIDDSFLYLPLLAKLGFYSILFFSLMLGMIFYKNEILTHAKPLKPLLAIIGLHDNRGLELEKIKIVKTSFLQGKPLTIAGYVLNKSENDLLVPDIRIRFRNKEGKILRSIIHNFPAKVISVGERSKISNRFLRYPEDTSDIVMDIGDYLEFLIK